MLNFMLSKDIIKNFFSDSYDKIINYLVKDMEVLAKGINFYCGFLQSEVTVIGIFHGFEADLPGRCKGFFFKKTKNFVF